MRIKCICLNLWTGGKLFDAIVDYIQKEQPDILACQEVYNGHDKGLAPQYRSIDALQDIFHFPYVTFEPCFKENINGTQIDQGNAIFSKFPITKASSTFFDQPYRVRLENIPKYFETTPRNIQHAAITIPGATILNVFNVQGVWGVDGNDNPRRLAMGKTIMNTIGSVSHVILTGDLNVRQETETIHGIETHLTNVFKNELVTSFNMRHKMDSGFADAVVDMLFVSPDVTVSDHYVSKADVSDHLSLVVTLEV